jgi:acetyltransferase-like isoleucine patch superfamily enzyme
MNTLLLDLYNRFNFFLPETRMFSFKNYLLRLAGAKIGRNVRICSSVKIIGNGKLEIGSNTWIGPQTILITSHPAKISIGSNVDIAPRVYIGTGTHEIDMKGINSAGRGISLDITIEDGVWIGAGSTILPNIIVGYKAIVAAAALVNRNIPSFCIAGGTPSRLIKKYNNLENCWERCQ